METFAERDNVADVKLEKVIGLAFAGLVVAKQAVGCGDFRNALANDEIDAKAKLSGSAGRVLNGELCLVNL